jgi:glycerophosphoryl diester phosphodiesterase
MRLLLVLLLSFALISCEDSLNVVYPDYDPSGILGQTTALPGISRNVLEGIYEVIEGKQNFGDDVVLKWQGDYLSVYSANDVGVMILEGGSIDTAIFFKGFWRQIMNENSGAVDLVISKVNGASGILAGDTSTVPVITGAYGISSTIPDNKLRLKYLRPLRPDSENFLLVAHRGGGRNSDFLGSSENTLEMIKMAERLGGNGVEIDIRLSKDGVPFLYHDPDINLRLTQKSVLKGKIEDFTFPQIRTFIRLKNGELIPSLREALEFIVLETNLRFVWLDLKSEKDDIALIASLRNEFILTAQMHQREIEILFGIGEVFKSDQLKNYPGYQNIPTICELGPGETRDLNSQIWAPRWTEGLQNEEVLSLQAEGKRVIVWTLDQPDFIRKYLEEGYYNGILSNYTPLVAYYHYTR